jgi:hypothetical protein
MPQMAPATEAKKLTTKNIILRMVITPFPQNIHIEAIK